MMKIIAYYLPQFHEIPENNIWWGKGYTEWTSLKKAYPLFYGHNQPRIPLHDFYYDLSDEKVLEWQVKLAKQYGIYGFCVYHYWFNKKRLLQKPLENFLLHPDLFMPFCICWANESWTNAWVSDQKDVLIKQDYGDEEEWTEHFYYLLPFFKNNNYIRIDDQLLFIIYRPELISQLSEMLELWNKLAKENNISKIAFASQQTDFDINSDVGKKYFSYQIEYQPDLAKKMLNAKIPDFKRKKEILIRDYDEVWREILSADPVSEKSIPGAFVDWDNTPRHQLTGSLLKNVNPQKFQQYLFQQMIRAKIKYHKNILFLFAWNEWTEGGYLEPDVKNGYKYLNAVKKALIAYEGSEE